MIIITKNIVYVNWLNDEYSLSAYEDNNTGKLIDPLFKIKYAGDRYTEVIIDDLKTIIKLYQNIRLTKPLTDTKILDISFNGSDLIHLIDIFNKAIEAGFFESYFSSKGTKLSDDEINQLQKEIDHILDSGANSVRLLTMFDNFLKLRSCEH